MPEVTRASIDSHVGHASPSPSPFHQTAYAVPGNTVYANGNQVIKVGDLTICGDPATAGSGTVFVNGQAIHRKDDATGGHESWVPNASNSGSSDVFAGG